jgi:antitoxin YefM
MTKTTITTARSDLYNLAENAIKYNDIINISTKNGNVVMMSEDDYDSLVESLYLAGIPGVYESIRDGMKEPIEDGKSWDEIKNESNFNQTGTKGSKRN